MQKDQLLIENDVKNEQLGKYDFIRLTPKPFVPSSSKGRTNRRRIVKTFLLRKA
jgi:hypothetical protein